MTIKSDRWIRKMAAAGMIEPFEPQQVRFAGEDKVISYGTSSYGYDVRCSREFKVLPTFTQRRSIPSISTRTVLSTWRVTSASFRPTPLRSRVRWSTSASREMC